jgi:hypothetical protein
MKAGIGAGCDGPDSQRVAGEAKWFACRDSRTRSGADELKTFGPLYSRKGLTVPAVTPTTE